MKCKFNFSVVASGCESQRRIYGDVVHFEKTPINRMDSLVSRFLAQNRTRLRIESQSRNSLSCGKATKFNISTGSAAAGSISIPKPANDAALASAARAWFSEREIEPTTPSGHSGPIPTLLNNGQFPWPAAFKSFRAAIRAAPPWRRTTSAQLENEAASSARIASSSP